jgi:hypothetical protein
LSLPPLAVSTTPSERSRRSSSSILVECRVTIAPSLAVKLLSCRALHHCQVAIVSSIAANRLCALGPSLSRLRRPSPSRSRHAVHCLCRGAAVPSIAIKEPSRCPSPSRIRRSSRRAALTLAGVVTNIRHSSRPSQASCPAGCCVASPHASRRRLPSAGASHCGIASCASRPADCRVSSLLTPPPPICRHLLLSLRRRLLSRPSWASHPAG